MTATDRDATIRVEGELDLATADLLTGVIAAQLGQGRSLLLLDLGAVSFADCAALGAIVTAHNQCLAAHGQLTLTHAGPPVTRLLRLTHLDEALHVTDMRLTPPGVTALTGPAARTTTPAPRAATASRREHRSNPCG